MLTLPIKKQWFDMIKSGEKTEEYRDVTPYYNSRFKKMLEGEHYILLRNGYGKHRPTIKCLITIDMGYGVPEWGARVGKIYYILKIIERESDK